MPTPVTVSGSPVDYYAFAAIVLNPVAGAADPYVRNASGGIAYADATSTTPIVLRDTSGNVITNLRTNEIAYVTFLSPSKSTFIVWPGVAARIPLQTFELADLQDLLAAAQAAVLATVGDVATATDAVTDARDAAVAAASAAENRATAIESRVSALETSGVGGGTATPTLMTPTATTWPVDGNGAARTIVEIGPLTGPYDSNVWPVSPTEGQTVTKIHTQDAFGGRTIYTSTLLATIGAYTFDADYKNPGARHQTQWRWSSAVSRWLLQPGNRVL